MRIFCSLVPPAWHDCDSMRRMWRTLRVFCHLSWRFWFVNQAFNLTARMHGTNLTFHTNECASWRHRSAQMRIFCSLLPPARHDCVGMTALVTGPCRIYSALVTGPRRIYSALVAVPRRIYSEFILRLLRDRAEFIPHLLRDRAEFILRLLRDRAEFILHLLRDRAEFIRKIYSAFLTGPRMRFVGTHVEDTPSLLPFVLEVLVR